MIFGFWYLVLASTSRIKSTRVRKSKQSQELMTKLEKVTAELENVRPEFKLRVMHNEAVFK